ncbi:hypothetical protein B0O80DRAFT_440184 [Mortierella sp. GBAus27b]|nr:hypothetical protein B0O80DRAFT_440184 [Mortierella sp. GBAus27b]
MKINLALALLSVIPQSFLVAGAPTKNNDHSVSNRNGTDILPPTKKLNLEAYHEAILKANNITRLELGLRLNVVAPKSAPNAVTMIHCVGVASEPLRVMVFPNVHGCDQAGWTHFYSFITYTVSSKMTPVAWCIGDNYNPHRAMLLYETNCSKFGWSHITSGFGTTEPKGISSFVSKSADNRMYMNPYKQHNAGGFKHDVVVQHQAVLLRPLQDVVDYVTNHCSKYPSLYKRPKERYTFSREIIWYGQLTIEAMESVLLTKDTAETYRIPDEATFNKRVELAGLKSFHGRVRVELGGKKKQVDGSQRHQITMYHVGTDGKEQYMAALIVPSGLQLGYENLRSAFSEAVRDHTTVIMQQTTDGSLAITPLFSDGSLPGIYLGR